MAEDTRPQSAQDIVAELMSTVQFRQPVGAIQKMRQGSADTSARASHTKLRQTIQRYGLRKKVDPLGSFMELIYEAAGNVDYLRTEVNKLNSMFVAGHAEKQEIAAYVRLYNDERDRLQ